jgi:hypothetical protein
MEESDVGTSVRRAGSNVLRDCLFDPADLLNV